MAKVLLIDDDDMVRNTIFGALSRAGHEVIAASNGRNGIEQFSIHTPDIVITDIIMPDQEGLETILAIRKVDSDVPIIAMSGAAIIGKINFLANAETFGANQTLRKPFRTAELMTAVDYCLGLRSTK